MGEKVGGESISIIIPLFNEKDNIIELYSELKSVLQQLNKPYEILFVDDGSTDGSLLVLSDLAKSDNYVRIIKFRRNFGQSAALKAGFDHTRGDFIITMDADLQNDPKDIPALFKKLTEEDYDTVCGWRLNRRDTFIKKLFSGISNTLRKILIRDNLHDYGCTLRAYRKKTVEEIELYGEMHRYIPAILSYNGYRVGEIQVNHRERRHGTTKYNWKRLFKGFSDLFVITFWSRFAARPMHIFGAIGLLIAFFGFVATAIQIFQRLLFNQSLSDKPLFILSVMSIIVGMQFIAFGIIADIAIKIYYKQRNFKNYRIDKIISGGTGK